MKAPEQLQPGYVLHSRRYRESSLIVDLFCRDYGVVPAVARGVRRGKSNHKRALLQPFQPLQCRWRGKGELVTLTDIDQYCTAPDLSKDALYCGLYINELLLRLLHRHDPHEEIFHSYHKLLMELAGQDAVEAHLRNFEFNLLDEIGYGMSFEYDVDGEAIVANKTYYLTADSQFNEVLQSNRDLTSSNVFPGRILLAIQQYNWHDPEVLKYAKQLIRMAMQPLLGAKPLQSRQLFRSLLHDS